MAKGMETIDKEKDKSVISHPERYGGDTTYECIKVLFQTNKDDSYIGFYDYANEAFYEKSTDDVVFGVIAWCEIPKYKEE